LFTSREPLNVAGEALFHVGGLTYPKDAKKLPADVGDFGAVKLLLNQARLIHPQQGLEAEDMEAISRICQLVQGMPLAIILAAGWLEILSPGEIADEIGRGLDLLESEARGIPDRQRSVWAAFDYSWNRLSPAEQDSFMKLAVFRGGFTRQAAGTVTGADLRRLRRFADISLIDTVGPNRYAIHELLRQFAAEKLEERGLTAATREAHSAYYLKALAQREADLRGSKLAEALDDSERDFENSRRAWNWAIERENETLLDHALESFYLYCFLRSRFQEGAELLSKAAGLYADDRLFNGRVLARLAFIGAVFARELQEVVPAAHESLQIAQHHGNKPAIAFAHFALGFCHHFLQDHAAAIPHYEESLQLFRELGDRYYTARTLQRLGDCYATEIGAARSMGMTREALELALEIDAFFDACVALKNLGIMSTLVGNFSKGEQLEREGVNLAIELGFPHIIATTSVHLGLACFLSGDVDQATQLVRRGLALGIDHDVQKIVADGRAVLALLSVTAGNYERALRLALQSEGRTSIPDRIVLADWALAMVYTGLDQLDKAMRHLCQAFDSALFYGWPGAMTWLLPVAVVLLSKAGQRERAVEMAALSSSHELSSQGWKDLWELYGQVNDELARELDPATYQAARERGAGLDVKETAVQLIEDIADTKILQDTLSLRIP
jgi:predicted ATPase